MEYLFAGLVGFIGGGVAAALYDIFSSYREKARTKKMLEAMGWGEHSAHEDHVLRDKEGPRHP